MDDTKVLIELKSFVVSCGSQKEAAKALGISTQYLNDLLRGRRNVSEEIAGKFGYKAEWVANGERLLTRRAPDVAVRCARCRYILKPEWRQCPNCGATRHAGNA